MFFKAAVIVIVVSALMSPRAAEAATRYAAPDGAGVARPCSEAAPCSLGAAIFHAVDGDRIVVAGGRYEVAQALDVSDRRLEIVAGTAAARPVLVSTVSGGSTALSLGAGSLLRDIDIVQEGAAGFALAAQGTVERVRVTLTADFARGIRLGRDVTIRDTVVFGTGHAEQDAMVAYAQTAGGSISARLRNVTVVADGADGVALEARSAAGRPVALDVRATVLRGVGGDAVLYGAENAPATMRLADSNLRGFAGVVARGGVDLGGVREDEPVFVDRAAGDLRPAAGSPTIDAGSTDEHSGARDVAGLPRTQGDAPDVGAHEHIVAPPVRLLGAPEADTDTITVAAEIAPGPWRLTARWRLEVLEGDRLAKAGPWTLALFSERQRRTFNGLAPDRDYRVRVVATGLFGESTDETAVRTLPVPGAGVAPQGGVVGQPADVGVPAAPGTNPAPGAAPGAAPDGGAPTTTAEPRPAARLDRTAPTVRLAWRGRGIRLTLSEAARVTIRVRARGGRTLRTRTLQMRGGATTVRVPRITRSVCSVRIVATDAAGNRATRTFTRRCR